jgi:hypothetical protein
MPDACRCNGTSRRLRGLAARSYLHDSFLPSLLLANRREVAAQAGERFSAGVKFSRATGLLPAIAQAQTRPGQSNILI